VPQAEENGGPLVDFQQMGHEQNSGQKGWGLRGKRKGLANFEKGFQTIEFKFEFEFQQPKEMHQHECNN
jgi:hypothetical protein